MKRHNKPMSHGATLSRIEKIDKSQISKAHLKGDTSPTPLCPVCPYFFLGHAGHILDISFFQEEIGITPCY